MSMCVTYADVHGVWVVMAAGSFAGWETLSIVANSACTLHACMHERYESRSIPAWLASFALRTGHIQKTDNRLVAYVQTKFSGMCRKHAVHVHMVFFRLVCCVGDQLKRSSCRYQTEVWM